MTLRKVGLSIATTVALLAGVAASLTAVEAREMRVSTFEPPQAFLAQVLAKWIDEVNPKLSDGTSLKLYPGGMLGAPAAQQELVRKGVADVAFIVTGYTPGVFPRTSVANLPFIAPTSKMGTNVIQTLLEEEALGGEYDDFKVIGLFTTNGYSVFSQKEINVPSDMAGLKLRTHDALASAIVGMMGANGVGLPAPQTYEAIERGVVDGAIFNFTAAKDFRMDEVTTHVTYVPFTNTVLAVLMNRAAYERLSDADRKVIDDHSGRWFADWVSKLNDEDELLKRDSMAEGGLKVNILTDEQFGPWIEATKGAQDIWLKTLSEQGIDGKPLVERAKAIAADNN
jgi:TRAP-type C4-dicarboxylate transport system substrate-binding protein